MTLPDSVELHHLDGLMDYDRSFACLSATERARANRLPHEQAEKWMSYRAELRTILGQKLGLQAQEVPLLITEQGKPYIDGHPLYFNLSHSYHRAILATAPFEIGIDLEWMNPRRDMGRLARRFYAPAEAEAMSQLSEGKLLLHFYRAWTAKEAAYKLVGGEFSRILHHSWSAGTQEFEGKQIQLEFECVDGEYSLCVAWWG